GAAYVFTSNDYGSWVQSGHIGAPDGTTSYNYFGISVSGLTSNIFLVGAYGGLGSVYVFTNNGYGNWVQSDKIAASDGESNDRFGNSVSGLSSSILVVGAYGADNYNGSVYVFTSNTYGSWVQSEKIVASDGENYDFFAYSVSGLSSSTFVVGAYGAGNSYTGSAYVFTRYDNGNSWTQLDKVVASDGENYDFFGQAVSGLGNSSFVVGASGDDEMGSGSGSAYVFTSNAFGSWVQADKVIASDGSDYDSFGHTVSGLSSSALVVGSIGDDNAGTDSGSIYVFTSGNDGNWVQSDKVVASDSTASDYFGYSVSGLSSSTYIVGAPYKDDGVITSAGSVYVF
ncbi:unnamed protein product, partial [Heterosigma akashiwo]